MTRFFAGLLAVVLGVAVCAPSAKAQSLAELEAAALSGNGEAAFLLAERYRLGVGVLQSHSVAAQWYSQAATEGDFRAQFQLGKQLVVGLGVDANTEAGLALLRSAATSGDAEHLYALGNAYQTGVAGNPDLAGAAEAFARAAEAGSDEAAVALGVMYQEGDGVAKDIAQAITLYEGPADRGHARAQNNLGLIYARGDGVLQDYERAHAWFDQAAAQGLPQGLRNLAALYENGFGVPVDEVRAQELFREAALGGSTNSLALFGDPRLRSPDPEAINSYIAAATAGDPIAGFNFGLLLMSKEQASIDETRIAAGAFQRAAEKGVPAAMANLGMMMFEGRGILQDYVGGYAWMTVAISMGLRDALDARDALSGAMTLDQINAAQATAARLWQSFGGGRPER